MLGGSVYVWLLVVYTVRSIPVLVSNVDPMDIKKEPYLHWYKDRYNDCWSSSDAF